MTARFAVEQVQRVWTATGPVPELQRHRRERLAAEWPDLARALHVLAALPADTDAVELSDTLYQFLTAAMDAHQAANPAAAVDAIRAGIRHYHADQARHATYRHPARPR